MADSNDRPTNGDTNHNDAHADAPNDKDEEDFLRVMRSLNQPTEDDLGLGNIFARDLEVGEKAQDAVDYEDLSDEDLPEEEDATTTTAQPAAAPVAAAAPEAGGEGVGMENVDMDMNMAITDLDLAMGMGMDLDLPNLGFEIEGAPETAAAPHQLEPIQEQPREEDVDSLFGGDDEEVGAQEAAAEDALDDLFGEAEPELPTDQTAEQPADAEKQEVKREEEEQYPFAEGRQVPLRPAPTGGATPLDETRRRESAERRGKEAQAEAQRDEEEDEDEEAVRKSREPTQEAPEEQQEEPDMDPATFKEWQLQQALFAMSSYGMEPPAPPENHEELLASLWPRFRKDELPRFLELLPPKRSYFIGKQPAKTPKKIVPTRLHLELAMDQERSFRSSVGSGVKRGFDGRPPLW
ncbi:hypothetical protein KEM55_008113 [Ascosphaera atra]|nr:hypothetical protein KEM55_008113 [Ascosphaera atra]